MIPRHGAARPENEEYREWLPSDAGGLLTAPNLASNKYTRGVLGLRTGSNAYPGAAVLGVEAAWRTGLGSVRYTPPIENEDPRYGLPSPAAAVLAARPETVFANDTATDRSRCDAWLIGSGTDANTRSFAEREALLGILAGEAPVAADAGALELIAESRLGSLAGAPVIITPHAGEFARLCVALDIEHNPGLLAQNLNTTVLLKGSRTIAVSPDGSTLASGPATPWLATAGTGDVLGGIIGALLAVHAEQVKQEPRLLAQLGATAAVLHDRAARIAASLPRSAETTEAAENRTSSPITALDVALAIPAAFATLREGPAI